MNKRWPSLIHPSTCDVLLRTGIRKETAVNRALLNKKVESNCANAEHRGRDFGYPTKYTSVSLFPACIDFVHTIHLMSLAALINVTVQLSPSKTQHIFVHIICWLQLARITNTVQIKGFFFFFLLYH